MKKYKLNKMQKRLIRIILSLVLFVFLILFTHFYNNTSNVYKTILFIIYLLLFIFIGYDVIYKAIKNIINLNFLDEYFLMTLATIVAFILNEFNEAIAIMLFYQVGEYFQDYAVKKSRNSISSLMEIIPDSANLYNNGNITIVDPSSVNINDIIQVNPGEKIPLDGIVIKGSSNIDLKALSGESRPKFVSENSEVLSGSINLDSILLIKVSKTFDNSTVNKILELVENSTNLKSKPEKFITRFSKIYTPSVVILAILLVLIGGLITKDFNNWINRGLNFLVVSCPCSIVISIPLVFFSGIGNAAKKGILIKGSTYLENFNKIDTFVFDKTGTLTKGNFEIVEISPLENKDIIINSAYICEKYSSHPIALAIKKYINKDINSNYTITNISGKGIKAYDINNIILCGNELLLKENNINFNPINKIGTIVYVAKNNKYLGYILIKDTIKEESKSLINYLNKNNKKSIMLSGDNKDYVNEVAKSLNISKYYSNLLPNEKYDKLKTILDNKKGLVSYIGDGINDAPSIMLSDIGISMGSIGSDAAIEASDIVLTNDNLENIIYLNKISKKTILIAKENIYFTIIIKSLILILSSLGFASIWLAVFGDVGVALICVFNALRTLKNK